MIDRSASIESRIASRWTLTTTDRPSGNAAPSFDAIYQQLEEDRVNRRARRYLRDLRRDAVIDYR